jgi:hypothetical protein
MAPIMVRQNVRAADAWSLSTPAMTARDRGYACRLAWASLQPRTPPGAFTHARSPKIRCIRRTVPAVPPPVGRKPAEDLTEDALDLRLWPRSDAIRRY